MDAFGLLVKLHAQGMQVSREGETLWVEPAQLLTPAFRGEIKAHKAELLELIPPSGEVRQIKNAGLPYTAILAAQARLDLHARRQTGGPAATWGELRGILQVAQQETECEDLSPEHLLEWAREMVAPDTPL